MSTGTESSIEVKVKDKDEELEQTQLITMVQLTTASLVAESIADGQSGGMMDDENSIHWEKMYHHYKSLYLSTKQA